MINAIIIIIIIMHECNMMKCNRILGLQEHFTIRRTRQRFLTMTTALYQSTYLLTRLESNVIHRMSKTDHCQT